MVVIPSAARDLFFCEWCDAHPSGGRALSYATVWGNTGPIPALWKVVWLGDDGHRGDWLSTQTHRTRSGIMNRLSRIFLGCSL